MTKNFNYGHLQIGMGCTLCKKRPLSASRPSLSESVCELLGLHTAFPPPVGSSTPPTSSPHVTGPTAPHTWRALEEPCKGSKLKKIHKQKISSGTQKGKSSGIKLQRWMGKKSGGQGWWWRRQDSEAWEGGAMVIVQVKNFQPVGDSEGERTAWKPYYWNGSWISSHRPVFKH